MSSRSIENLCVLALINLIAAATAVPSLQAQAIVPGTGQQLTEVGDDFEDPEWSYDLRLPKVYNNKETTVAPNTPGGISANRRWYEGSKRGQPDWIQRVATPEGGLPGSAGALAFRSKMTGSNHPSYEQQQDDLICNVSGIVGKIPVSRSPSVVTRVWFPPFEHWEKRSGCHFAFRVAVETEGVPGFQRIGFRRISDDEHPTESWPGFFVNLDYQPNRAASEQHPNGPYHAYMWMKATSDGRQIRGPRITQTGWWTLGISMTPDGQVHYYARPGIDDLTAEDHIASAVPFGKRTLRLRNFFYNVCSGDNGQSWSTPFVVDDPAVYVVR